jgi:hypothetical protein
MGDRDRDSNDVSFSSQQKEERTGFYIYYFGTLLRLKQARVLF